MRAEEGTDAPTPAQVAALPLSFAQQRLWFLHRLMPESAAYVLFDAHRLVGELDVAALARALGEVVRRHEVLRSHFPSHNGRPVQVALEPAPVDLPMLDLSDRPAAEREQELTWALREDAGRAFDLAGEAPLRTHLYRLGAREHVLALAIHHIAYDAWSARVLFAELESLYGAFRRLRPSPLPELGLQYADYVVWQRRLLAGDTMRRQLDHWRDELAGAPLVLEMPFDRPRPPVQRFSGRRVSFELEAPLPEGLRKLARRRGVTTFMVLLAGFQALLHRWTCQATILVGTAMANRRQVELEGLIGLLANMLVMRADFQGDPSGEELLHQVRRRTLGALANQDLPFERLVEALAPDRETSRNPVVQVLFAYDRADGPSLRLEGVEVEPVDVEFLTSRADLLLHVAERPDGFTATFEYDEDLFEEATVAGLADHLRVLLAGLVANPACPVGHLPLFSPTRRRQLQEWGHGPAAVPQTTIHQLVQQQAARRPHASAVLAAGHQLSYADLEQRSHRLARHLLDRGLRPGSIVAVCLERETELVVSLLAILEAGCAYLPLDPANPVDRLAFMLSDCGASLLVTRSEHVDRLPAERPPTLALDREHDAIAARPVSAPGVAVSPDALAYVMYTSGSTGRPKAVMIPHRAVVRLVCGGGHAMLDERQVLPLLAPVSFDASTLELWGALCSGGRLAVYPPGLPLASELARFIRERGITVMFLSTGLFNQVVDVAPDSFRGLRQLLVGGEAMSPPHARRVLAALPDLRLCNAYGPTECTTFACAQLIGPGETEAAGPLPIGRPIGGTTVHVLDGRREQLPAGAFGELCVGGPGLAHGYLERADLTAERFIPDPFAERPGDRLYRTGDRVRWRSSGVLEFAGRFDHQVKVRGFRVEPGEVESVLLEQPGISACAVVPYAGPAGVTRLAAYLAGIDGYHVPDLRNALAARLPDYMLPTSWQVLDYLPLNENGKVDRGALQPPDPARRRSVETGPAPRDELEARMAGVWRAVLGVDQVGIDDGFFELGGNSLLLVRLQGELERELSRPIALIDLLREPTIRALSTAFREAAPLQVTVDPGDLEAGRRRRRRRRLSQQPGTEAAR